MMNKEEILRRSQVENGKIQGDERERWMETYSKSFGYFGMNIALAFVLFYRLFSGNELIDTSAALLLVGCGFLGHGIGGLKNKKTNSVYYIFIFGGIIIVSLGLIFGIW